MYRPYLRTWQTAFVITSIPVWVPVGEATVPPACLLSNPILKPIFGVSVKAWLCLRIHAFPVSDSHKQGKMA